jgi:hypothetical protein
MNRGPVAKDSINRRIGKSIQKQTNSMKKRKLQKYN